MILLFTDMMAQLGSEKFFQNYFSKQQTKKLKKTHFHEKKQKKNNNNFTLLNRY